MADEFRVPNHLRHIFAQKAVRVDLADPDMPVLYVKYGANPEEVEEVEDYLFTQYKRFEVKVER